MSVRKLMSLFAVKAIIFSFLTAVIIGICFKTLCSCDLHDLRAECLAIYNVHRIKVLTYAIFSWIFRVNISLIELWNNKTMEWVVIRDNANL